MYHLVGLFKETTFKFFLFALGYKYEGVKFERGNCGVSIMRSGKLNLLCCSHQFKFFCL